MSDTMASEWSHFQSMDIAPSAPEVQRMEMRKAFYAGIASGVKLGLLRTKETNLAEMREYIAAEDLRRSLPHATWFDGGNLGNGHCSFMWARNGQGACCILPHGHDGVHRDDFTSSKRAEHE